MKIACIYHSIDLDGWMSAAIVKHLHTKEVDKRSEFRKENMALVHTLDCIGYNYGQPIPDLSWFDKVIMCDISFPIKEMEKLRQSHQDKFIWIDHHISTIKSIKERCNTFYEGIRDTKFAACELTWGYFFHDEPMPEIVRLLGRYDCFGHKGTNEEIKVLEFQYGARQCISNYEEAYYQLKGELNEPIGNANMIYSILNNGKSIYKYLCTEAKQTYKNGFEITFTESNQGDIGLGQFFERKFICINKERFNPINFGIDYHKDGYDGAACFHYDGVAKLYRFSLYNDNGLVDCSIIAKQFGGGGHRGSAGFVVDDEEFLKIINQDYVWNTNIE